MNSNQTKKGKTKRLIPVFFLLASFFLTGFPIWGTIQGDINGDNSVDVGDVNYVINMILGRTPADSLADLNGDSTIDVSDVNRIINIILHNDSTSTGNDSIPNGNDSIPNGNDSIPNGNDSIPNGNDSIPNGNDSIPNGNDSIPNGNDSIPNGNDSIPDSIPSGYDSIPELKGWIPMLPSDTIKGAIISTTRDYYKLGSGRMAVFAVNPGDSVRITIDHDNTINVNMKSWAIYDSENPDDWLASHALASGINVKSVSGTRVLKDIVVPDSAKVLVCSGYFTQNGRIGDGASASKSPFTAYQVERWDSLSKMPQRHSLKVLAVGNSFTCDELSYVPYVIKSIAPDVDVRLRLLTRGSGKIKDWACNVDSDSVSGATNKFYEWKPFPGRWSLPAASSLRQSVMADNWDVILFQQVSTLPYWETVDSSLVELTGWLRNEMGYEGKIGWMLTHAYSDSDVVYSGSFPELTCSDEMWQLNVALADSVMHSGCVDLLIPSGTAVQIARHTRLGDFTYDQLCAGCWYNGARDVNTHLQEGVGPFTAACAAAGALLNQSPVGARVQLSSSWIIPGANPTYSNINTNPTLQAIDQYLGGLGMDDASQQLATECAAAAIEHPYRLDFETEPDTEE